jgi:hypothetical protein
MSGDVGQTAVNNLFWTGTVPWVVLWATFVIRLAWLDARLRAHLTKHHPYRWRRLPWTERLTWSVWFVFQSRADYGDPIIGAQRRAMLTVFYDMLLVLAAMIVWFVISAAIAEVGP